VSDDGAARHWTRRWAEYALPLRPPSCAHPRLYHLAANQLPLEAMIQKGEGQFLEFKKSLRLDREAAQAIVVFANSKGGQVLFGVTDEGDIKGVQLGKGWLEKLANSLQGYIYPSLPFQLDPVQNDGSTLVRVVVPADVPPVIGAYVYSTRPLTLDTSVDASHCQGYRRVGRTSQQVDFMWLRGRHPSDPVVLVDGRGSVPSEDAIPARMRCAAWLADGGPAYELYMSTNPAVSDVHPIAKDFPGSDGSRSNSMVIPVNLTARPSEFRLVARYMDDWGCRWESSRLMSVTYPPNGSILGTAEFSRRIITFPPKRLTDLT